MIDSFHGQFRFLSNFYPASVIDRYGFLYPTTEHAFQAAKTRDPEERERIRTAATPGQAKRLGRKVTIREDWDTIRVEVMERILRLKFADPKLRSLLIETWPHELVEGNTWGDTFWGVCQGQGENHLGRLLMKLREELTAT